MSAIDSFVVEIPIIEIQGFWVLIPDPVANLLHFVLSVDQHTEILLQK